jgi:mono/diheme cytochrome c family protein
MPLGLVIALYLIFALAPLPANAAQQSSQQLGQAGVNLGPPMSGADIFKWYCAACHGKTGKGDGPAASEFKVRPPDLTLLSKRNKGKFPGDYVTSVLRNGPKPSAHGTAEMPTWGPLFAELNAKGRVTVEIEAVVRYLEGMQQK